MLRIMAGDHQSAATAPLDLRTTIRERGTPDCKGRIVAAAPLACTGTDRLEKHSPAVQATLVSLGRGASHKRKTDSSPCSLPLRKRKIHFEPETPTQSPTPPSGDRFSPPVDADITCRESFAGQARDKSTVAPAYVAHRRIEEPGQSQNGYPIHLFYQLDYGTYPMYCWPPPPELNRSLAHQTENLLASIALATRQDEDGDTALHIAVVQGELTIVNKLIQLLLMARRTLDIYNNLRQTPLHLAVITQQTDMVKALLRSGADPAALDRNGQTAMHLCCEYDQRDCLSVVLSFSSSCTYLEIRNFEGLSPLHLAVLRGHKDLARMLLDAGADINAMDIKSGQSPLMHAVETNNADMVHFLIESGCDVNSQSYSGNTALHSACGRGQVDTVRLLLKSGADSSLKNYHNDTPVMVAKSKKIADVLRGRGSNQTRLQEQHCMPVSLHERNLMENGSPTSNHSNHSHGCSPSTTPHSLHHSTSHSPKTSSTVVYPFF